MTSVCVLQTCDPHVYKPLMDVTSSINRVYSERRGLHFLPYIAVYRGLYPWHAVFNRIYLLLDQVYGGRFDWAIYLDADAFFADMRLDVCNLLDPQVAFIFSRGGNNLEAWNVNSGVMLVNLRHAATRDVLEQWRDEVERRLPFERLARAVTPFQPSGDQGALQHVLRRYYFVAGEIPFVRVYRWEEADNINYRNGRYIRHLLRTEGPLGLRIAEAEKERQRFMATVEV